MKLHAAIRRVPQVIRNGVRDMKFGRPLGGTVKTRYGRLGAYDVANSEYENLEICFASIAVGDADVLVDVGCGKGRSVNWFLSRYAHAKIVGVELDPAIAAKTAHRLRRHANVTIVCGDVTELIPPEGTIFYLFNPFDETVMRRFADAVLTDRFGGDSPPTTLVYFNCKHITAFEANPRFSVRILDDPKLAAKSAIVTIV